MNSILDFMSSADSSLLLALNGSDSSLLDFVMWHYSQKWIWIPFYLLLFAMIIRRYPVRSVVKISLCIFFVILLTDQVCASLIRPEVARMRPTHSELAPMIETVNGYRGGGYGFPSCHAANSAALTAFLAFALRSRIWLTVLVVWAVIMGYSRMYLGVHYPSDVLAGYTVGGAVGILFGLGWHKRRRIGEALASTPFRYIT